MTVLHTDGHGPDAQPTGTPPVPPALEAVGVSVRRGERRLIDGADLSLHAGEVVAIAGRSGAGKTTLVRVLAGLERPVEGTVVHRPAGCQGKATVPVGFVPQDDIVHRELSVRRTLQYAAALRLPAGLDPAGRRQVVESLMVDLGLADRAEVRVDALSGGQRKRVSIAVELLAHPDVLLLDEPTSGLDPATAADVLALLHRLADRGVAVALTTHREADIEGCDRVVLVSDGRITGDDTPEVLLGCFGAARVSDLYRGLGDFERRPEARRANLPTAAPSERPRERTGSRAGASDRRRPAITPWRQVALLTRRNGEVMVRNRLTLAVLLGSPLLVTAMMATLFGPGSFDGADPSGVGPVHLTFWLAFAGFFFGLTYGLLQVVVERPVLERDRFAGVSPAAYVASKVLVLAPLLVAVAAVLLVTLRELERLPALGWPTMAMLLATLTLESLSALALGLLASALVRDPAQATLALPMLCFPQVLFSGAVVPVGDMTVPGRLMSAPLANRWGFEALGRDLGLGALGDLPAVGAHGAAFSGSVLGCWAVLALSAAALILVTRSVLGRTTVAPPS